MTKEWRPGEPLSADCVVARLDQLGWSEGGHRLDAYTRTHALLVLMSVFDPYVILSLVDGHEVASYSTLAGAREAFRVIRAAEPTS